MQITSTIVLAAVLLASETLAMATSPGVAHNGDGTDLTARVRRHHNKRCNKRSPSTSYKANYKSFTKASNAASSVKASTSTSSASAGASSPSSTSTSNSSGLPSAQKTKLGLSWTYGNVMNITEYTNLGASWYYTWDSTTHGATTNAAFFPMLWGASADNITQFQANVNANPSKITSKVVMAFNEPDQAGQSNVDVSTACSIIEQVLIPLKQQFGFKIIGPAPADAMGTWYTNFAAQCPDTEAQIDYSALHFYNTDPNEVITNLQTFYSKHKKPIYITETACWSYTSEAQCTSEAQASTFLSTIGQFVAKTEWMYGFAPFGLFEGTLPGGVGSFDALSTTPGGAPTALFKAAASATVG